jgi:hypothetical protein
MENGMNIPRNKFYGLFVPFFSELPAGEAAQKSGLRGACPELRREEGAAGHRFVEEIK